MGNTQFMLQGQSGAVFQTGTTWGTIGFSASVNTAVAGTASASMAIPATPLVVDHAIATSRSGDLDIQVWGYDNTYSAGGMSFTFYDLNGNVNLRPESGWTAGHGKAHAHLKCATRVGCGDGSTKLGVKYA
jgi:hypothetical protein